MIEKLWVEKLLLDIRKFCYTTEKLHIGDLTYIELKDIEWVIEQSLKDLNAYEK